MHWALSHKSTRNRTLYRSKYKQTWNKKEFTLSASVSRNRDTRAHTRTHASECVPNRMDWANTNIQNEMETKSEIKMRKKKKTISTILCLILSMERRNREKVSLMHVALVHSRVKVHEINKKRLRRMRNGWAITLLLYRSNLFLSFPTRFVLGRCRCSYHGRRPTLPMPLPGIAHIFDALFLLRSSTNVISM